MTIHANLYVNMSSFQTDFCPDYLSNTNFERPLRASHFSFKSLN